MNQYHITIRTNKTERELRDWLNRKDFDNISDIALSSSTSPEVIAQSDWVSYLTIQSPYDRNYIDTNKAERVLGQEIPLKYTVEVYSYKYRITSIGQGTDIQSALHDSVFQIISGVHK